MVTAASNGVGHSGKTGMDFVEWMFSFIAGATLIGEAKGNVADMELLFFSKDSTPAAKLQEKYDHLTKNTSWCRALDSDSKKSGKKVPKVKTHR